MKEQDTYEKYASFLTSLDCNEPQSQQLTLQTLEATCEDSILYFRPEVEFCLNSGKPSQALKMYRF